MSDIEPLEKPSKVVAAVNLLYATLGIGVVRGILEWSQSTAASSVDFVLFVTLSVLGLLLFFIYMIGKGKNWARIIFLVLFILGVPLSIMPLILSFSHNPVSGVLGLMQAIIQVIALIFLFQKDSSMWFKTMKKLKLEKAQ